MSDKVRTFCNRVHVKLATLDSRLDWLKLNSGPTWHFLQEKLDEVRDRGEARQQYIDQACIKLDQWRHEKRLEERNTITHWRKNRETKKLDERAQRAEDHAGYAMQLAEASIDQAERMILEAISARLDAESVRGDDIVPLEIRPRSSSDIIHEEHVVAERVLDLLEQACALIRHGESPPIGFKRWTIGFFFQFANRCHHSQEASARSSTLQFRGVSSDGGPVGAMLAHHKRGRAQIHRMQHAVDRHDHAEWSLLAGEYAHLLRQQFQHEKQVLLQMAEVCGTEEDHADLANIFRSADREQGDREWGEQFDTQIEQWEQRFGISAIPMSSLAMPEQEESKDREAKPTSAGSRTDKKMSHATGAHGLAIRDCETDMDTLKTLLFDHKEPPRDTSDFGRGGPRRSK